MKLSVSNIAWDNKELERHLALLRDLDCDGVEIAPSCIWEDPANVAYKEVKQLKSIVEKYCLEIPAFHALLFTRPDLRIFGGKAVRRETIAYLKTLIKLAGDLSVKVLVYGSPKSRAVGDKPRDECYKVGVDVFFELAKEASRHDTCFCIEPLGPSESDFINTAEEGYRLVKNVASSHFGLHLDVKAMVDANENFEEVFKKYGGIMKHFHVGDPGLTPPAYTGLNHSKIGVPLSRSPYNRFVSIEMKRGFGDSVEVIKKAVGYVRKNYLIA